MSFREEFFLIGQSQTRTAYDCHISCMIGMIMEILYMISHTSFMQSNNSLCLLVSEGRFFFQISETVSECFLAPTQQFSAISLREQANFQ